MGHVDPIEDDLNNQFIQLMASSNQNVIYDIARYLKRAFKIRSNPHDQIVIELASVFNHWLDGIYSKF